MIEHIIGQTCYALPTWAIKSCEILTLESFVMLVTINLPRPVNQSIGIGPSMFNLIQI